MDPVISIVLHLVLLHTVDGRETFVNPAQAAKIDGKMP